MMRARGTRANRRTGTAMTPPAASSRAYSRRARRRGGRACPGLIALSRRSCSALDVPERRVPPREPRRADLQRRGVLEARCLVPVLALGATLIALLTHAQRAVRYVE